MDNWYVSIRINAVIDNALDQQAIFKFGHCQSIYSNPNEKFTEVIWFVEANDAEDALLNCANELNKILDDLNVHMKPTHIKVIPEEDRKQELLRQTEG